MGIDYSVTLGVGVSFRNRSDAQDFLINNLDLSDEQLEELEDDFGAFEIGNITVECMNQYSGDWWFVGVPLYQGGHISAFIEDVKDSAGAWNAVFPNVVGEIICEVAVS